MSLKVFDYVLYDKSQMKQTFFYKNESLNIIKQENKLFRDLTFSLTKQAFTKKVLFFRMSLISFDTFYKDFILKGQGVNIYTLAFLGYFLSLGSKIRQDYFNSFIISVEDVKIELCLNNNIANMIKSVNSMSSFESYVDFLINNDILDLKDEMSYIEKILAFFRTFFILAKSGIFGYDEIQRLALFMFYLNQKFLKLKEQVFNDIEKMSVLFIEIFFDLILQKKEMLVLCEKTNDRTLNFLLNEHKSEFNIVQRVAKNVITFKKIQRSKILKAIKDYDLMPLISFGLNEYDNFTKNYVKSFSVQKILSKDKIKVDLRDNFIFDNNKLNFYNCNKSYMIINAIKDENIKNIEFYFLGRECKKELILNG